MKRFWIIPVILILWNTIDAQYKSILIRGQQVFLNSDNYYDALSLGNNAVILNTNGFYGPYSSCYEYGYSKEYWYNKHYLDSYPASSVYLYSGTDIEYDRFSRFGVKSTTLSQKEDFVSIRGQNDSLFFRSDYYCHRRLVISYLFVRQSDVQYFDQLLDKSFSKLYSGYYYLVLHTTTPFSTDDFGVDTAYLLPVNVIKEYKNSKDMLPTMLFRNDCYRLCQKSGRCFISLINSNNKKFIRIGGKEHPNSYVYIVPVTGFMFKTQNGEELPCFYVLINYGRREDGLKSIDY